MEIRHRVALTLAQRCVAEVKKAARQHDDLHCRLTLAAVLAVCPRLGLQAASKVNEVLLLHQDELAAAAVDTDCIHRPRMHQIAEACRKVRRTASVTGPGKTRVEQKS